MKNNEENIIYIDDGSRKISILISNKRYDVIISAGNLLLPRFNVDDNFNYRQYVSNELLKAIQSEDRPQIEDIEIQDSEFFEKIFDVLLSDLNDFYAILDETHCDEVCEKYIRAYCIYCKKNIHTAFGDINKNLENVISDMEKSIKSIFECFNSS